MICARRTHISDCTNMHDRVMLLRLGSRPRVVRRMLGEYGMDVMSSCAKVNIIKRNPHPKYDDERHVR